MVIVRLSSLLLTFALCTSTVCAQTACTPDKTPPTAGDVALFNNDDKTANTLYAEAVTKNPNDAHATLGLVRTLLDQDKVEEADAAVSAYEKTHPNNSMAETMRASVLRRQGDIPDSYRHIQRALALDMCNGHAHYRLASLLTVNSMYYSAKQEWATTAQLLPNDDWTQVQAMEWMPIEQAVPLLKQYLASTPYSGSKKEVQQDIDYFTNAQANVCLPVSAPSHTKLPLEPIYEDWHVYSDHRSSGSYLPTSGPDNPNYPIHGWGLDVQLNGKRHRLEINTLAGGLILTEATANKLGLKYDISKPANKDTPTRAHVDDVRIGDFEFKNCDLQIVKMEGTKSSDLDGTIGLAIFANYAVTVDYPGREVQMSQLPPLPATMPVAETRMLDMNEDGDISTVAQEKLHDRYVPPEMKDWTRIYRYEDDWLVPTHINAGPERLFILNTNQVYTYVDENEAKKLTPIDSLEGIGRYTGSKLTAKWTPASAARNLTFYYAGIRQDAQDTFVAQFDALSAHFSMHISGTLGLQSYSDRTLSLDYRDGLIKISPPGKH